MKQKKRLTAAAVILAVFLAVWGGMEVGVQAQNVKVTINGTEQVSKKKTKTFTVKWNDSCFKNDSSAFNSKLAYLSIAYSAAAYTEQRADYVNDALRASGFQKITSGDSYSVNKRDGIGYTIASKTLSGKDGAVLLAVILRGSTGEEWYGNFDLAENETTAAREQHHYNFKKAETGVMQTLTDYCAENGFEKEHTKIWITGHSRGAAVANLLAADVNESALAEQENVYAYTFATPNTTKDKTRYDNIFNLLNEGDLFAGVPIEKWGYRRYGTDIVLPDLFRKAGVSDDGMQAGTAAVFQDFTGADYSQYRYDTAGVANVIKQASDLVDDTTNFYTLKFSFGSETATMYQYFQTIGDLLAGDDAARSAATRKLGKSVLGEDDFTGISISLMNLALSGNVYFVHMPENYLSWLQIMSDSDMKQDGSMDPVIIKQSGKAIVRKGKKETYSAIALGTKKKVIWTVSDKKIARITPGGRLIAKKKGTVKLTAKAGGAKAVYKVKIK